MSADLPSADSLFPKTAPHMSDDLRSIAVFVKHGAPLPREDHQVLSAAAEMIESQAARIPELDRQVLETGIVSAGRASAIVELNRRIAELSLERDGLVEHVAELVKDQRIGLHAILDVAELKKRIAELERERDDLQSKVDELHRGIEFHYGEAAKRDYQPPPADAEIIGDLDYLIGAYPQIGRGLERAKREIQRLQRVGPPPPAAPYEAMFTAAVQCLAEISRALDIPDDVASVADGNAEILDAIEVLKCGAPPSGSLLQSFLTVCNRVIEDEHAQGVACGIDFYSLRVGVNRAMAAPRAPETQAAPPSEHQALLSHCVEAVEDLFNREVVERDGYVGYQSLWDRHNRRVVETGELLADLRAAVTQAAPPAAIRELFNKGVGVQAGNRLSMSFETEEEANRAFHYLAELGELETSRPPQTKDEHRTQPKRDDDTPSACAPPPGADPLSGKVPGLSGETGAAP